LGAPRPTANEILLSIARPAQRAVVAELLRAAQCSSVRIYRAALAVEALVYLSVGANTRTVLEWVPHTLLESKGAALAIYPSLRALNAHTARVLSRFRSVGSDCAWRARRSDTVRNETVIACCTDFRTRLHRTHEIWRTRITRSCAGHARESAKWALRTFE